MTLSLIVVATGLIVAILILSVRGQEKHEESKWSSDGSAFPGIEPDYSIGRAAAKKAELEQRVEAEREARLQAERAETERQRRDRTAREKLAAEQKAIDNAEKLATLKGRILGFCADYSRVARFPFSGVVFESSRSEVAGRSRTVTSGGYWDEWAGQTTEVKEFEQTLCTHTVTSEIRVYSTGLIVEFRDEDCALYHGETRCRSRHGKKTLRDNDLLRKRSDIEAGLARVLTDAMKRHPSSEK